MPSGIHEALVLLFRDSPTLGVTLARRVLGLDIPEHVSVQAVAAEFAELQPAEYRADVVLRVNDTQGKPLDVLIVEVQLQRDAGKHMAWLQHAVGAHLRMKCPATVIVFAPEQSVATWCSRPVSWDRGRHSYRPLVIGPTAVPVITDEDQANELPELAVLSAFAHGEEEGAELIAAAALSACRHLDSDHIRVYSDIIFSKLRESAARALEKLMDLSAYPYPISDWAKKHYGQGLLDSARSTLRRQLALRFGELPPETDQKLTDADEEQLRRWLDRFATASELNDVFGDE